MDYFRQEAVDRGCRQWAGWMRKQLFRTLSVHVNHNSIDIGTLCRMFGATTDGLFVSTVILSVCLILVCRSEVFVS